MTNDKREIVVPENLSGKRLDTIVHELLTEFSRSKIQQWINDGHVKVDGQVLLSKKKLYGGKLNELNAPKINKKKTSNKNFFFKLNDEFLNGFKNFLFFMKHFYIILFPDMIKI